MRPEPKDFLEIDVPISTCFLDLPEGIVRFGKGVKSWIIEPHPEGVSPGYQRNAYLDFANGKMRHWGDFDEDKFTRPTVSLRRDGTNAVTDGGGRILKAELAGKTHIPVKQLRGKTREREAEIFEDQKHIRKINRHHTWNAAANNPSSPDYDLVTSINRVFRSLGWTVGPGKSKSIASIEQIEDTARDFGINHLRTTLMRINMGWGDATTQFPVNKKLSPDAKKAARLAEKQAAAESAKAKSKKKKAAQKVVAVSGIALYAVADLLKRYPKLDVVRLDEIMHRWSPKMLAAEVKLRNGNRTPHTRDAIPATTLLLIEFYDHGLRINQKLAPEGFKLGLVAA